MPGDDTRPAGSLTEAFGDREPFADDQDVVHADRYVDLGSVGAGGMGEVRRVHDRLLDRVVAMKLLRDDRLDHAAARDRFRAEALVTAGLQHPSIVPVHDFGIGQDHRPFFTMKEVQGRTLGAVIREVHGASSGSWGTSTSGWTLRRLVDAVERVCEAVAFAHARGVVHRDLKPSNVMAGDFGEVMVLDWGIARAEGDALDGPAGHTLGPIGTPGFMAPEQAAGASATPAADVYAMGSLLYQVLAGRPPYEGDDALDQVLAGPPPPPSAVATGGPVPPELEEVVLVAMARDPGERTLDAAGVAERLRAWLDGARKREQALVLVARADALVPEATSLRRAAADLRARAATALDRVPTTAPVSAKLPAWDLQEDADAAEREADAIDAELVHTLHGALGHVPDLPEANQRLADHYRTLHQRAEARGDAATAALAGSLLRTHDRGHHAAYLAGTGRLTLVTDPPAEATLWRFVPSQRRLVLRRVRALGRTPLAEVPIEMGSYVVRLDAPGHATVDYPVRIDRLQHWDGVAPGGRGPAPIVLPRENDLAPDDVYVPAGWFFAGGDPMAPSSLPAMRVWVDGFVMRRFPVTNEEYLAFLDDLFARGREGEALRYVPRERATLGERAPAMIYGRRDDGTFELTVDADGHQWSPDQPVCQVDFASAVAHAAWRAERDGLAWRLPFELEREKAARGVDGRLFPWGDHFDPTFCCVGESHTAGRVPAQVGTYPEDESPYGIRHLAGNMRDWGADVARAAGPRVEHGRAVIAFDPDPTADRLNRGGTWSGSSVYARCCSRGALNSALRYAIVGIRLVRSFPEPS